MSNRKHSHQKIIALLQEGKTFNEIAVIIGCSKSTVGNVSKNAGFQKQERHGHKNTRTYRTWAAMKNRCLNPVSKDYEQYGAKGILVCDRWKDSFSAFLEDMGEAPEGLSIDRINSSLGYEPANCRWADSETQNTNRSCVKPIFFRGRSMSLAQWCRELNLNYGVTWNKLYRKELAVEDVFT